jgi:hypothetical protein
MEIVSSAAEYAEKLAAAVAYQATLNDKGKVKGTRTLAREAKEAKAAKEALEAEDATVMAMAEYYCNE